MTQGKWTVDTHLFRELGELLVGRDSTALVELVKNAYDADATEIVVNGILLDDPMKGYIVIDDNGVGMQARQFEEGFLRIASRLKEEGQRSSRRFKRRFTGAKGIGRLAAHKLARVLEVYSIPWDPDMPTQKAIRARIDWDEIEAKQTLEEAPPIEVWEEPIPKSRKTGTTITLRNLRRKWTPTERGRFIAEARTFEPPEVLSLPLPKSVAAGPLLFDSPRLRDSSSEDPGCKVRLMGDFAGGDEFWQAVAQAATWAIEIEARKGKRTVEYVVAPTRRTVREYPDAAKRTFSLEHPDPEKGPFFQARILVREGPLGGSSQENVWANEASGIRVFMEGFRVLPYGERGNDWLSLDADYTRRSRSGLSMTGDLVDDLFGAREEDSDWGLTVLPNRHYFGAVFLTHAQAPSLRILVNREGFVPDAAFESVQKLIRLGIDLSTRLRAAVRLSERQERRQQRAMSRPRTSGDSSERAVSSIGRDLETAAARASSLITEAKRLLAADDRVGAAERLSQASQDIDKVSGTAKQLISEGSMLRVLASVGTQMAAFVHETRRLLGTAEAIFEVVARLREDTALAAHTRKKLSKLQAGLGDLKRDLDRQASYLLDVVTPDARRRRVRLSLAECFKAGARLIERIADRREIQVLNEIPPDLKSPPMFPAELTTIFANLLTNATKAAGQGGKIRATAKRISDGSVSLVIENNGAAIDLDESERWFRPFESTTVEVDPILGQGMGLGLPITRSMLEEYGADIRFIKPGRGYATAVEIVFPK